MAPPSQYHMANAATGGRLGELLNRWRPGDSYERIARRLSDLYGIDTTASTVKRWCDIAAADDKATA